jgi:hypothetical protein
MTRLSRKTSLNVHGTHRPYLHYKLKILRNYARFEDLMVVLLKILVFLVVSAMSIYQ